MDASGSFLFFCFRLLSALVVLIAICSRKPNLNKYILEDLITLFLKKLAPLCLYCALRLTDNITEDPLFFEYASMSIPIYSVMIKLASYVIRNKPQESEGAKPSEIDLFVTLIVLLLSLLLH
jgi:hypothetical protein